MEESEIRSEISTLQDRMNVHDPNNKISRHIDSIRSCLETDDEKLDEPTLTNHEIGSASNPVEDLSKNSANIYIPEKHTLELQREMKSILDDIEQLSSNVESLDPDDLSNSLTSLHEGIFGVADDIKHALFKTSNEPEFREHIMMINRKNADLEDHIKSLKESLNRIEDVLEYGKSRLGDLNVPSQESVKDEIRETRTQRAKREFEEMKPYTDMQTIRRNFNEGEVFTPQDLADSVDVWTKSTAKSCIDSAKEVGSHGDYPEIEQIDDNKYRLTSN